MRAYCSQDRRKLSSGFQGLTRGIASLLAALLCGCSSAFDTGQGIELIESVDVPGQALSEIISTDTQFMVPHEKNEPAWERARAFFCYYSSTPGSFQVEDTLLTNQTEAAARFWCEVTRRNAADGVLYTVACGDRRDGVGALVDRNARNLARFIQAGILERSLLAE
jgi:hypothetical protein